MNSLFDEPRFVPFRWRGSWAAVHEGGHAVTAAVLGCPVLHARIHERGGGDTLVNGDPRDLLLIALGGHAAELIFAIRDSDIRCSAGDYQRAFAHGVTLARDEERTAPASSSPSGRKAPAAAFKGPIDLLKLSAVSVAQVEAGAEAVAGRIGRRWAARASVLVAAAEIEVLELLSANRRATRLIAEQLEQHKQLDAVDLIALAGEGRLEHNERRRWGT